MSTDMRKLPEPNFIFLEFRSIKNPAGKFPSYHFKKHETKDTAMFAPVQDSASKSLRGLVTYCPFI